MFGVSTRGKFLGAVMGSNSRVSSGEVFIKNSNFELVLPQKALNKNGEIRNSVVPFLNKENLTIGEAIALNKKYDIAVSIA